MYYPYLRARQFELIAVREMVKEKVLKDVVPIFEPVNESVNNLILANDIFLSAGFNPYLIVNPSVGDDKIKGDKNYFLSFLRDLSNSSFIPAFIYNDNAHYIRSMMSEYNISNCLIICLDTPNNDAALIDLAKDDLVEGVVLFNPSSNRSLDRSLKNIVSLKYIRLDDLFEKKAKNADYLSVGAHKFSEEHLYYEKEGFTGFSDFTLLPMEYVNGGATPRAVTIHLSYINKKESNEIWVKHFTSETAADSISNVQGKFYEAAAKAISCVESIGLNNPAIDELKSCVNEHRYPGLGVLKKISLKNHLFIMSSLKNM